ncbi:MAG: hypothetical protein J6X55_06930 [Victivallales bacterium]|nr:hypothetical protein [Victivallales bacterium]
MAQGKDEISELFKQQVARMTYAHFLVLCWCAQSEDLKVKYNITNCFDDLKSCGVTRTKQTAVAIVETLYTLSFVDVRDEKNRKNLYISAWGAKALQQMVLNQQYVMKKSSYLEDYQS